MYLSNTTHTLEIFADAAPATTNPQYHVSYNDHTSSGMTLPQSSSDGNLNGSTIVTALSAPASSTNRQVLYLTVYNADTATRIVTIQKSISSTKYIIIKSSLAPGATLEYSREHGWTVISQTSQNSHIITEFSSNGTWTKPANIKAAIVCCVGGGSGGGSGARNAAGTNRFGGGSGAGGAVSWQYFPASSLAASYAVTIGLGGTGGTGITADNTNGNNGNAGGNTSFGSAVIATGAFSGGGGGTTSSGGTSGSGGQASGSVIAYGPYTLSGGGGGTGTTSTGSNGSSGLTGTSSCPGGSPGQGINSSNTAGTVTTTGGGIYVSGALISGPSNGVAGSNNVARSLFFNTSLQSTLGIGTGGSGGNAANLNGTNGGYGAGGGGGAGTLNGTTSGAGGNGGNGFCVVLEIY